MPLSEEVGAKVSPEMLIELDRIARIKRRTRAEIIRQACEDYLARLSGPGVASANISERSYAADWLEEVEDAAQEDGSPLVLRDGVTRDDVINALTDYLAEAREEGARYEAERYIERWYDFSIQDELDSGSLAGVLGALTVPRADE